MRKNHENKFTMYNSVNAFLNKNRDIINGHLGLDGVTTELGKKCDEIKQYEEVRRTATVGRSVVKIRAKRSAITACLSTAASLYALAKKNSEGDLEGITDLAYSKLERMRDTELLEVLESVHDMALARIELLEPFGLTAESLERYRLIVENYKSAFDKSQTGMTDRKHATSNLPELFRQGDSILTQIDKFVDGLKEDEQEFYEKYYIARALKLYGVRHVKEPESSEQLAVSSEQLAENSVISEQLAVSSEQKASP